MGRMRIEATSGGYKRNYIFGKERERKGMGFGMRRRRKECDRRVK